MAAAKWRGLTTRPGGLRRRYPGRFSRPRNGTGVVDADGPVLLALGLAVDESGERCGQPKEAPHARVR
jgi:hypothetical protein